MKQMLVWEPSIYKAELDCKGCMQRIPPKAIFTIDSGEIQYLLPTNSGYQAYSVRCAGCGFKEMLINAFGAEFRQAMTNYDPVSAGYEIPLMKALRRVVREELQQILREEAYDPKGPFSPGL